jgi:hypothetical protein
MAKKEILIIDALNVHEHEVFNEFISELKTIDKKMFELENEKQLLLKAMAKLGEKDFIHFGDQIKLTFETTTEKIDFDLTAKKYGIDPIEFKLPKTLNYFNLDKAMNYLNGDPMVTNKEVKPAKVKII